ncbi:ATP-dependent DNA ligase [Meridianimarinicoccus roseus]|uniref:DNA ligase (ATP) n=1 Tax=Meridianimarinicoccus roseus TaxID=2072018 RepID=A0A2V2LGB1_9RHOB|nr:ATP-dependent DNA ligase [Meridianimarinicoccus roseus]PWR04688.1 ATP-dependent DNA ligase [Meridianimarinicoccus roseus]
MRAFAKLFRSLDQTTRTSAKVAALADYFDTAPERDKLWTIALLSGRRPKRLIGTARLRDWAAAQAQVPLWLLEDSYAVVGDLAETIALLLPPGRGTAAPPLAEVMDDLSALAAADEDTKRAAVLRYWDDLPGDARLVFNKLITGGFRMGVSRKLMTRALSRATGIDEADLAHRLMGNWTPHDTSFTALVTQPDAGEQDARPYPFYLAYQIEGGPETLGPPGDWLAEYKWDGIRGQLIRRGGDWHLWSRGEDLVTDRFPELAASLDHVPDGTVLDGELLAWKNGAPLPFAALQKRLGRKTVPKSLLRDAPVILLAYDLLEHGGQDIRARPLEERRAALEGLVAPLPDDVPLRLSRRIGFDDWDALAATRAGARSVQAEGLMLKRRDAPYLDGRRKGDWWKWKLDPMTVDAVMIYAQAGHGRRANLYTDYTFAVWDEHGALVPFTKAYSGLTDAEFGKITAWVRRNTLERFGPVRRVTPELVFEIAFEGIQESRRHKSGIALRFPRMARWRHDKSAADANTLADLRGLLPTG